MLPEPVQIVLQPLWLIFAAVFLESRSWFGMLSVFGLMYRFVPLVLFIVDPERFGVSDVFLRALHSPELVRWWWLLNPEPLVV